MRTMEMSDIIKEVAREWRINDMEIWAGGREEPLATARMVVYYIARQCGFSTVYIGQMVNRDHSTVSQGFGTLSAKMRKDHALYARVRRIAERCGVGMAGEPPPALLTKKDAWDATYTRVVLLQARRQMRETLQLLDAALENIPAQFAGDLDAVPEPPQRDIAPVQDCIIDGLAGVAEVWDGGWQQVYPADKQGVGA